MQEGTYYFVLEEDKKHNIRTYMTDELHTKEEAFAIKKELEEDELLIKGKHTYHVIECTVTKKEII